MVIGIFGESCTGKSTLAAALQEPLGAELFSGKDYLRLGKNESGAKQAFQKLLREAGPDRSIIYIITEREQLPLLPDSAVRILVTAEPETIKARFAQRMHGNLPAPVAAMLERKHGSFDQEPHHIHVRSGQTSTEEVLSQVQGLLSRT